VAEMKDSPMVAGVEPAVMTLQEGDEVHVGFPGATGLDVVQRVRHDGRITVPLTGEVMAEGQTPAELESELLRRCGSQLVNKEVRVSVVAASYPVFVAGAVLRPGKLVCERRISALEAVMEAGGFDRTRADLTAVRIIRQERGQTRNLTVNLKRVLDGKDTDPVFLRRADIVYVPEKFAWF
jgi:protein involved in polysaccharide export with SLBB domain